MKDFFKGVRKHIDRLDAEHLREQYERVADEVEFLDKIFLTIDRGIVVLDDAGRVSFCNPAARALLGMEVEDALPQLEIPLGKDSKRELEISYPEARTLELQTVPMKVGTLVHLRDVTSERRRTEEELRAGATEAVKNLASGVAHEIGNPLNALSLNLRILKREQPANEVISECLAQIDRLDGILKGFLQALRPSRPNLKPGSVAEPLKRCLATLKPQFEEKRITVTLNMPSALPIAALDAAQLEQVFFNLLKNALEATRNGGTIVIGLESDDNDLLIGIRDSGVGMTSEQIAALFEPYRTSKRHGNGLGLMISKRIVHDHGGRIDVESTAGVGTVFTVRIPRIERRIRQLKG